MTPSDRGSVPLLDLYRQEVDTQAHALTASLLSVERQQDVAAHLEAGMRAAHSLKGAARVVGVGAGVRVASAMEECFVAAQRQQIVLRHAQIDRLLAAIDLLKRIASTAGASVQAWDDERSADVDACLAQLDAILVSAAAPEDPSESTESIKESQVDATNGTQDPERVLRVTADSLNRLLGLAGESLVASRWTRPLSDSLVRLKRLHRESMTALRRVHELLPPQAQERVRLELATAERTLVECQQRLSEELASIEAVDRRSDDLAHRLYDEALACRMQPFADGVHGFPRMVRDLSRSLGKQARLDIVGLATQVDRDILQKLEAPLNHLLRNAVDHGIEPPEARQAAGKPAEGIVRLEALHNAGMLQVIVSDDGSGVDVEKVRAAVVQRNLVVPEAAQAMTDAELLEFLFLPGFTVREQVTDISGRGVGLDVVRDMVNQVRGIVRIGSTPGGGTRFQLQLPVTLSVVRTLLVDVAGEPYAFPLTSISRAIKIGKERVERVEGRQHIPVDGRSIGLLTAHEVMGLTPPAGTGDELSVIVAGGGHAHVYGFLVDAFLGERELVVQPLDPQLGKISNVAAGALMDDGCPVLIVDTEDLIRAADKLCADNAPEGVRQGVSQGQVHRKRVLIVDDSMTVRELERKLLSNLGYDVDVAVDGVDGWNAVRTGHFDLVVTDIDMPRMDGIELVTLINQDPNLKSVPVMIVSYKDRDEDRRRGLEAGAAHYLTKGSFHDETLARAVFELIGEAEA
jgi:two-component system sensor histidine kinase and response regulator WspE